MIDVASEGTKNMLGFNIPLVINQRKELENNF